MADASCPLYVRHALPRTLQTSKPVPATTPSDKYINEIQKEKKKVIEQLWL